MIRLYCNLRSTGARDLVRKINELRPGVASLARPGSLVQHGDLLVGWGNSVPSIPQTTSLNKRHFGSKWYELEKLEAGGVPVPPHSLTKRTGWLGRTIHHQQARDLIRGCRHPDYYVEYIEIAKEFRIHVFNGVSIRAGIKRPRVPNPNPRFRSWEAGWALDYGTLCQDNIKQSYREIAKKAVKVLGYDFGAVDLGVTKEGKVVVFEVNRAPGLEGNTVVTYANKLLQYYDSCH